MQDLAALAFVAAFFGVSFALIPFLEYLMEDPS
jgi:hypothetical protein